MIDLCEQCGETEDVVVFRHATVCEDCGAAYMRELFNGPEPVMLQPICGKLLFGPSGSRPTSVCLEPYGTEHDHS